MSSMSRRQALTAGAGLALLAGSACDSKTGAAIGPQSRQFPADFLWGTATSAFQIEGALAEDGRGATIWDVFQNQPGRINDGSTAAVACDSYHRARDDTALLSGAGCNAYRFSLAWSRILPDGAGAVNDNGLDYYKRLVDGLLESAITPYPTLFHWDLPQALFEKGGWANRETAQRLGDYAAIVAKSLGDRVKNFIILNEAAVHTIFGHVLGMHAPGLADAALLGPVAHHQNLAQGLAITALRSQGSDFAIGTSLALMPIRPGPNWLEPVNAFVADRFDQIWNRGYLDPLLLGTYPQSVGDAIGKALRPGDLETAHQKIDFLGVNYYAPAYVRFSASSPAFIALDSTPKEVELDAFQRHVDPAGLGQVLMRLHKDYGNPKILITENGVSDPFATGPAILDDKFRITFLRRHLEAVKAAMEAGSPVAGFFIWSLIDNWEWTLGYTSKFGLCARDATRTQKASYAWFQALTQSGMLDLGA